MKIVLNTLAVLFILAGGIWFLQGINVLPGSFMSGNPQWSINGGIMIVVGGVILWWNNRRKKKSMRESIQPGDRVKIFLDSKFGMSEGWFKGTVFKIDPYSDHRSFYWVKLDADAQAILDIKQISVFNPKNIQKLDG